MWASSWWTIGEWTGDRWAAVVFGLVSLVGLITAFRWRPRTTRVVAWRTDQIILDRLDSPGFEQVMISAYGESIDRLSIATFFVKNLGPRRVDLAHAEKPYTVAISDPNVMVVSVRCSAGIAATVRRPPPTRAWSSVGLETRVVGEVIVYTEDIEGPQPDVWILTFDPTPLEVGEQIEVQVVHSGFDEDLVAVPARLARVGTVAAHSTNPVLASSPLTLSRRILAEVVSGVIRKVG